MSTTSACAAGSTWASSRRSGRSRRGVASVEARRAGRQNRPMTGPQIIVLATPIFLLLIGIEFVVGWRRGRNTYRLNDALNSIGLGIMSQVVGVFSALLTVAIYTLAYNQASLWKLPTNEPWVWIAGLVVYDLCYYWHHRFGHTVAL